MKRFSERRVSQTNRRQDSQLTSQPNTKSWQPGIKMTQVHNLDVSSENWFGSSAVHSEWNGVSFLQQTSRKNDETGFSEDVGSGVKGWVRFFAYLE